MTRQRFGQHFLTDKSKLAAIAASVGIADGDTVLEIGPGHGELTDFLLAEADRHTGVRTFLFERDPALVPRLAQKYAARAAAGTLRVVFGNALEELPAFVRSEGLRPFGYKIAGNIPYYITGFLFRSIGDMETKPASCTFTIQKEVAERAVADAPHSNLLAASLAYWADAEMTLVLPKGLFNPPPEVDSATLRLVTRRETPVTPPDFYFDFLHALFKQPRKTAANNLKHFGPASAIDPVALSAAFAECGISPGDRPQHMHMRDIKNLARILYNAYKSRLPDGDGFPTPEHFS